MSASPAGGGRLASGFVWAPSGWFSSLAIWTAAETSGAASTMPIIPNRHPAPIVTISTDERVELEGGAEGERLEDVLQEPVRQDDDDEHDHRGRRFPCAPSARMTANAPATNAPMYGM